MQALTQSSIRSVTSASSKRQGLASISQRQSSDTANRAIPGPGDEIESDPDAGVLESEKVSVVFLVSPFSHRDFHYSPGTREVLRGAKSQRGGTSRESDRGRRL